MDDCCPLPSANKKVCWHSMTAKTDETKRYGVLIVGACFSIQAVGIGTYIAYGVFFNPLMDTFGWSRASVAGASSVAFLVMGVVGIAIGRLNDRFGPRQLMTLAAAFFGSGMILMAKTTAVWQLYLFYGLIFGMGLSAIDVIALTTVARWFTQRRGRMTGFVKVGTGAGQFGIPLMASILIANYGWRSAFAILGVTSLVLLAGIAQLLKRDPESHKTALDKPADRAHPLQAPTMETEDNSLTVRQALHAVQFWIICGINLTLVFCLLIVMVHIVPHAHDLGLSAAIASGLLSAIGAVSMLGRLITGFAVDRYGARAAMIVSYGLLLIGLLWLQLSDRFWMLCVFACIYGLAHGGFFTAISPLVAELFGIKTHGTLFGVVVFFGTVGGAIGPLTAGYVFDLSGSYRSIFWLMIALAVFGLALSLLLKPVLPKRENPPR